MQSILRFKFVILNLLYLENASYVDNSGKSILHALGESIPVYEAEYAKATLDTDMKKRPLVYDDPDVVASDFKHFQHIAQACVRNGCPIDAVNHSGNGWTAWERLKDTWKYSHDSYQLLLESMSPPTSVLRLEELSIRAILQHGVDYRKSVPARLREVIEGGVLDLDLMMRADGPRPPLLSIRKYYEHWENH